MGSALAILHPRLLRPGPATLPARDNKAPSATSTHGPRGGRFSRGVGVAAGWLGLDVAAFATRSGSARRRPVEPVRCVAVAHWYTTSRQANALLPAAGKNPAVVATAARWPAP